MKLKLYRDKVISMVKGKDLVGVYIKYPHFWEDKESHFERDFIPEKEILLAEMSPQKANEIIKLWNSK